MHTTQQSQMDATRVVAGAKSDNASSGRRTVRRIYLYAISGIALAISSIAIMNLLGLVIDLVLRNITGHSWIQDASGWERKRLSLFIPLLVIAGAIWWFHWRQILRDRHGPFGGVERRSRIRAVYLTVVLAYSLLTTIPSLTWMLPVIFERLFGRELEPFERNDIVTNLAAVGTVAGIWIFHWRTRANDVRGGPLDGIAVWLPRAYYYAVAALGAILLMFGASRVISVAGKAIIGSGESGKWWDSPLASGLSLAIAGGVYWGIHWVHSVRLLRGDAWWAVSERHSRLRPIYLVGLLVLAVVLTVIYIINGVEHAIWEALASTRESSTSAKVREILGPPLTAIPFIALWLYHRQRLFTEAQTHGGAARVGTMQRIYSYALMAVGLLFSGLGLIGLLWLVNLWVAGSADAATFGMGGWRGQLALAAATTATGAAVLVWHANQTIRRTAIAPNVEVVSTERRVYLFGAIGLGLVPLVIGLAMLIYQFMQRVLNVEGAGSLATDISGPLAIVVVAGGISAFHGVILRREMEAQPPEVGTQGPAIVTEPLLPPVRMVAIIRGPAGANLADLLTELQGQLPPGYTISPVEDSATDNAVSERDGTAADREPVQ